MRRIIPRIWACVLIPTSLCGKRERIALGGHGVSEATIEHRYETSAENFLKIYELCDQINIYDNSGEYLILAAYTVCGKLQKANTDIAWVNKLMSKIENKL